VPPRANWNKLLFGFKQETFSDIDPSWKTFLDQLPKTAEYFYEGRGIAPELVIKELAATLNLAVTEVHSLKLKSLAKHLELGDIANTRRLAQEFAYISEKRETLVGFIVDFIIKLLG
jgi:hypothetical protein